MTLTSSVSLERSLASSTGKSFLAEGKASIRGRGLKGCLNAKLLKGESSREEVESEMSYLLPTVTTKEGIDELILNTIDSVLVLRVGRATDTVCLHLDDVLAKAAREVSKFAKIALIDVDSEEIQAYLKYFDITLIPATLFFFNAEHMKMDSGTPDHTKWIGAFHRKQDFIDVVETIYRGAMKGKLIVTCPLPPERIPKFQLLYKEI
ncbi:hypothetical protein R1sor_009851 [Riccia sorocarpa]|uniref:Thioredoxin-like protein 4B n=1 Tax=Riccia sorocarpa TaxID=122646 RepID=A0ABD3HW92_9MARC